MYLEIILTIAVLVTGLAWLVNKKRKKERGFIKELGSVFPVILIVFTLRSFIFEPFRIPSGSMFPTLYVGDFIVVKKYSYGIRLPVIRNKIIETGDPMRGDVVVFRYPDNPSVYYIKRLIGLPGDVIELREHEVSINGEKLVLTEDGVFNTTVADGKNRDYKQFVENIDNVSHKILHSNRDAYNAGSAVDTIIVPEGNYFMMGDNRDNSGDSRAWGFVPDEMLVGKATRTWLSVYDWSVRWDRLGDKID